MIKRNFSIYILILALLFITGCSSPNEDGSTEITVSAAASLMGSLTELQEIFEKEHPNIRVSYNFGGSGSLRRQLEQGAPIDMFLSASARDYDKLVEQNKVEKGRAFLTNNLVLVTSHSNEIRSLEAFMHGEALMAVGTPETVPAGLYAKEALENLGHWKSLEEQNRLVLTKDVTQVLTLVKKDAAQVGVVYKSDVFLDQNVTIIENFASELHSPIHYHVAFMKNGEEDDYIEQAKEAYYEFLSSEQAIEVFEQNGFQRVE